MLPADALHVAVCQASTALLLSTCQVLEAYSNWLENRVVSRFDTAIAEGNYQQQAQVVAIMTELDKEKSIAKVMEMLIRKGAKPSYTVERSWSFTALSLSGPCRCFCPAMPAASLC